MRKTRNLMLALVLAASAPAFATDYVQAPGSSLAFAGKYQGQIFTGTFPGFTSRLRFDPQSLENSSLDVTIPLATATTKNSNYDNALHGAAFFNSEQFPQARYQASTFRALGDGRYAADGHLILRGITQPVTLEFTWIDGTHPRLSGRATVRRLQFDVGAGDWADTQLIPDAIAISTRVNFTPIDR